MKMLLTQPISINDIASKLGLSKSAVSKALNDRPDVGEQTKKRVRQLAAKLNYTPNHFAQALNSRKSKLIGVIMHDDINGGFLSQLVRSISMELQKHGYVTIFASSEKSGGMERKIMEKLLTRFVDGFILVPCANPDIKFINSAIDQGLKLVTIDNYVNGIQTPYVGTDFTTGSYLTTKFLIDCGHRKIGYIGGPGWATSTAELEAGYRKAHIESGLEISDNLIVACEESRDEAKKRFIELKKSNPQMTAVNEAGCSMLLGSLDGAAELGLNVPRDISIVSSGSTESVTALDQKFDEIGRTASKRLLDLLSGKDVPPKTLIIPKLVERNSVNKIDHLLV